MNIDRVHEQLDQAIVVLEAGLAAEQLTGDELRMLMRVAMNLVEAGRNEATDPKEARP